MTCSAIAGWLVIPGDMTVNKPTLYDVMIKCGLLDIHVVPALSFLKYLKLCATCQTDCVLTIGRLATAP